MDFHKDKYFIIGLSRRPRDPLNPANPPASNPPPPNPTTPAVGCDSNEANPTPHGSVFGFWFPNL